MVYYRPWSREECPIVAAWLDDQSPNLDRLVTALAARPKLYVPYFTQDDSPQMYALQLPHIQSQRSLCLMLQVRARQAIQRGDLDAALRDVEAIIMVSKLQSQQPLIVESLVSYALQGIATQTLRDIALHPNVTETQLAALAKLLETPVITSSFASVLEWERLATIDYVVATAARGQEGNMVPGNSYWERTIVCWDDVLRRSNELFDEAIAAAKADDWPAMQKLYTKIKTEPANYSELDKAYSERSWMLLPSQRTEVMKYALPNLFIAPICNMYPIKYRVAARHEAARTMVALERFRLANNGYPAKLAELVPKYLSAVPIDPFGKQPLVYKRTPAGYRAYSLGMNEADDGGEQALADDGEVDSMHGDLVFGSPDELQRKLNLAW